jgi:PAS domain S-box-containing protein
MKDSSKAKQALIEELASLRRRILELEQSDAEGKKTEIQKEATLNELQKSEEKYRHYLENAHDYIICMDLDGIIRYVNRAVSDLVGQINLIGLPVAVAASPDELKRHYDLLQKRREGDTSVYSFEWKATPPGSDKHFIMDVRSSALIENGKPSGVLMIARDMTDQKIQEEKLRAAKEKYQKLVEGVSDIIFEIDQQGVFLYCSPTGKTLWGYDPEEVIGKNYIEFVHPDDQDLMQKRFPDIAMWADHPIAFRIKTKPGEVRWARARMMPRIENGRFMGANGILFDVTKQKQLDEELRLQEIQLRAIIESTGNGILVVDPTGRVILSNRRYADLWNIPSDLLERNNYEALRKYVLNQLVDPDAFLVRILELYQSTETAYDIIQLKDGRILERYSYPFLKDGLIMGRVWSFRDITDQKKAETAQRNSELLFKNAFSMSPVIMGIHRLSDEVLLEINETFTNYTGYQKEELIGRKLEEFGFLDSSTMQHMRKAFSEQMVINNEEIQYKTKTGELRYGLFSSAYIGDNEEKKVLGLLFDITDRKKSEALLKLREEEARKLAKNLEEANIALRVVLSHRDEDQKILEEKIQHNINEIILPFISSLKSSDLEDRGKHYLDLLESNLKSILSPFMRNMSNTYKSLTPKEAQIAEMIREGKNSKDIADMLGTSVATISTHRNNIRKKLNMKKQKTNLRSHLLSLS